MLPSLGALKGVGSGLYNMGRGALFLGASKGATGAGKTMNALGHAVPLAPAVAGSFKATSNQPGFQPQSTIKSASRSELHPVVERALRAKVASSDWHRPVNALSYAAFAAPYLSQRVHDNHKLTTALNAAGLLGLGATSADSLANGDGLAGYDLAGLGLMGAGMIHGGLRPDVKTAGFGNMMRNATFAAMLHSSGTMPQEAFHAMDVGKKMVNPIAQAMPSVRALGNTMRPPATLGALAPRPV